jgi:hypothetical protein
LKDEDEDQGMNKFEFLAQMDELGLDDSVFSDPAALMRRQRLIMEKIEAH